MVTMKLTSKIPMEIENMQPKSTQVLMVYIVIISMLTALSQSKAAERNTSKSIAQNHSACKSANQTESMSACLWIIKNTKTNSAKGVEINYHANERLRVMYIELGLFKEAKNAAIRALELAEQINNMTMIVMQLNNLGEIMQLIGDFRRSERYIRRGLVIRLRLLGETHLDVASSLNALGGISQDQGKLLNAERYLRQAVKIRKSQLGEKHTDVATSLNDLAGVLQDQNKLTESEQCYRQALDIFEENFGIDHVEVAAVQQNLAGVLQDNGRLPEAEMLFRRSLEIKQKQLGINHHKVATTQGNLAMLLKEEGRLEEAEDLLNSALTIERSTFGQIHPRIAVTLQNIAVLKLARGELAEAERLLKQAVQNQKKLLGSKHLLVATSMQNLGTVFLEERKLEEAEAVLTKALSIRVKNLGNNHPLVANTLQNLAGVLHNQNRLEESEKLYIKSLSILIKSIGATHPAIVRARVNLATLLLSMGHYEYAIDELRRAIDVLNIFLNTVVTESLTYGLLNANQDIELLIYGLPIYNQRNSKAITLALHSSLTLKGRSFDVRRNMRERLFRNSNSETQRVRYEKMKDMYLAWSKELELLTQGIGNKFNVKITLAKARQLETELSLERNYNTGRIARVNLNEISNRLSNDSAYVDFLFGIKNKYNRNDQSEEIHCIALIVLGNKTIRAVVLGSKDDINKSVDEFLSALENDVSNVKQKAYIAYQKVFALIDKELSNNGVRKIILSPDGVLNAIPFGAMHDGNAYLADRLSFRYVTSGRDLLNQPSRKSTTQPAVMMATRVPGQATLVVAERAGQEIAQTQGAKLTEQSTDGQVLAQQSPSVLTLISHGYFGGDSKAGGMSERLPTAPKHTMQLRYMGQMGFERDIAPQAKLVMAEKEKTEELMNSSGLMMMPGLQASPDPKQDGRLTAVEVREMNLQGTKLVMLLACKGAAGGLSFGQGVYGLRRAVLQAGAETVVGTLWSVEEKSASELAKKYMTKLWTDKKATRVGAMEEAMKEMRQDPRYSHPHYWAPFVVMGMDGPLQNPL